MRRGRTAFIVFVMFLVSVSLRGSLAAQESEGWVPDRDRVIDNAGIAYGVTFGNLIYPGFKASTMLLAAPQAALAWILTLGDTEQAKTIWDAQTEGPYYISPEEARKALALDAEADPYYERELTE